MPATASPAAVAPKPAPPKIAPISEILKPSLDSVQTVVGGVKLDKWKGGSVRTEAAGNVSSIQKDLQGALPGLLSDADAAPGSMSKLLPVSRNLGALYDVLMRVWDGARIAAPGEQVDQLQQAMTSLDKARHAVDDRLQAMAGGSEKQIGDLQVSLTKLQTPPVCPVVAPPPPPPAPAPKKKVVKKKPATPSAAKPAASTPAPATTKPSPQ